MKPVLSSIPLFIFLFSHLAFAAQEVRFCHMGSAIEKIRKSAPAQDAMMRNYLRRKQVVFISGYLGCSQKEFADNAEVIRAIDPNVPAHVICPPSEVSVEKNVEFVRENLKRLSAQNQNRRIILIGQSKGGAEALQTAVLTRDAFKTGAVDEFGYQMSGVVVFNGALGGSLLADLALGLNPELNEKWRRYLADKQIPEGVMDIVKDKLKTDTEGFHSMTTEASRARTKALIGGASSATRRLLRQRVLFASTTRGERSNDMPLHTGFLADFMRGNADANDGLILESDQMIPGLGSQLLKIRDAGHYSLAGPYDQSNCRKEFMRLLLLKLAEWEGH